MKLKDYLLLSLIFAAIAAVAVFLTEKVVKETTPALPEIVKVEEVIKQRLVHRVIRFVMFLYSMLQQTVP